MGMCYYVTAHLEPKDESAAEKVLKEVLKKSLEAEGKSLDKYRDLVEFLLAENSEIDGYDYEAEFNASYGWDAVLERAYKALRPYLTDDSYMEVSADG